MGKDGKFEENFLYFKIIVYFCDENIINNED